jgi:hypothetical protein
MRPIRVTSRLAESEIMKLKALSTLEGGSQENLDTDTWRGKNISDLEVNGFNS